MGSMVLRLEVLDAESSQIGDVVERRIENVEASNGTEINGPFQVSAEIALHGCVCVKVHHLPDERERACNGPALALAAQAVLASKMNVKFRVTNEAVTKAIHEHDAMLRADPEFFQLID